MIPAVAIAVTLAVSWAAWHYLASERRRLSRDLRRRRELEAECIKPGWEWRQA